MHGKGIISIWFFIGALLTTYGVLIVGAGIAEFHHPPANVHLSNLHAAVWWGGIMLALGVLYLVKFRPGKE